MRALSVRLIAAAALLFAASPSQAITAGQLAVLSAVNNPKPLYSCYYVFGTTCGTTFAVTRSGSSATNLLPNSASGAAFPTYAANAIRLVVNHGILVETNGATNFLLNSGTPATQTTASLPIGSYALWVNGAGSAAVAGTTATITGAGTATNGAEVDFAVTVAGTVTVTVTGSLNEFQLENNVQGSSYVPTTTSTVTRGAETVIMNNMNVNGTDVSLVVEFQPNITPTTNAGLIGDGGPRPSLVYASTGPFLTFPGIANAVASQASITRFGTYRMAFGIQSGNMNAATNGVLSLPGNGQNSVVIWPATTTITFGWTPSPGTGGMHWIRGFSLYGSRLNDSLLKKKSIQALGNPF